jgi:predicted DNA-binding transcriptional regulator AlpA
MDQQVVDWKGLKAIGIPYCRAHIWRLMDSGDFPRAFKLGKHRNSHPVWWLSEILDWLKAHANRNATAPS